MPAGARERSTVVLASAANGGFACATAKTEKPEKLKKKLNKKKT